MTTPVAGSGQPETQGLNLRSSWELQKLPAERAPAAPAPAAAEAALVEEAGAAATAEALSALVNLGYAPGEVAAAVAEIAAEGPAETPALIRAALKRLAPKL